MVSDTVGIVSVLGVWVVVEGGDVEVVVCDVVGRTTVVGVRMVWLVGVKSVVTTANVDVEALLVNLVDNNV